MPAGGATFGSCHIAPRSTGCSFKKQQHQQYFINRYMCYFICSFKKKQQYIVHKYICYSIYLLLPVGCLDVQSGLLGKSCCPLLFWSGPIRRPMGLQRFMRPDDLPQSTVFGAWRMCSVVWLSRPQGPRGERTSFSLVATWLVSLLWSVSFLYETSQDWSICALNGQAHFLFSFCPLSFDLKKYVALSLYLSPHSLISFYLNSKR
jgi:hypothetical protein